MAVYRDSDSKVDMTFASDVEQGLTADFKYLPSQYFYDSAGDKLFQQIMHMPEYYLTNAEHEIFSMHGADIFHALSAGNQAFDLVEFGAGDGYKTKVLIKTLLAEGAAFRYLPIDISGDVLQALQLNLADTFPELKVEVQQAEYFTALEALSAQSKRPKLILFLGSNVGNFNPQRTKAFLNMLYDRLNVGDQLLIGYDLKKNPAVILKAYNDAAGITKRFNLNLLSRINNELDASFDLSKFDHYATYDPEAGIAKSYIVSLERQEVKIEAIDQTIAFEKGECIHTEISRKYSVKQMSALLTESNFAIKKHFYDNRSYFANTLATKL